MREMVRAAVAGTGILIAGVAWASWLHIPIERLVADSDLAVVGVLSDVRERKENAKDGFTYIFREGRIRVDEVVFGVAKAGDDLLLKWTDGGPGEDLNHQQHAGLRVVWLLRRDADGSVLADYPWRIIRLCQGDLTPVRKRLGEVKSRERGDSVSRLQAVVMRPPEYACRHHLW